MRCFPCGGRDVGICDVDAESDVQMPVSDIDVDILLATYNGERFLPALLESIANQDYRNWRVICRDDGSTDASLQMLTEFATRHPGQVQRSIFLRPQHSVGLHT